MKLQQCHFYPQSVDITGTITYLNDSWISQNFILESTLKSNLLNVTIVDVFVWNYRLCEKWLFSLCNELKYPALNYLTEKDIHGPVDSQFVKEKFEKYGRKPGTYLVRQHNIYHFNYYLHYISDIGGNNDEIVLFIIKSKETGTFSIENVSNKGKWISLISFRYWKFYLEGVTAQSFYS